MLLQFKASVTGIFLPEHKKFQQKKFLRKKIYSVNLKLILTLLRNIEIHQTLRACLTTPTQNSLFEFFLNVFRQIEPPQKVDCLI